MTLFGRRGRGYRSKPASASWATGAAAFDTVVLCPCGEHSRSGRLQAVRCSAAVRTPETGGDPFTLVSNGASPGDPRSRDAGRTSRPVSRILCAGRLATSRPAAIHLGLPLPTGSSGLPAGIGRATLERLRKHRERCPLGLAPGGVYRAVPVTRDAGGLLHHRFTLTPLTAGRSVFCGTFPRVTPGCC
jgi:hypothetical protein